MSSEIYEQMDRIFPGIPGTFPCANDVKVQGSSEERHDIHLLETVERAQEAGLNFNPDKCNIKKREIEYFGRVITPQDVSPCPKIFKNIASLSAPSDKQELQSILGSMNFLSTFVPHMTKKTYLMGSRSNEAPTFFGPETTDIKSDIANAVQIILYDPSKPATIETDSSQKGLGAV